MSTNATAPAIRPFQFDGDAEGMLKKSVNLYRGRVTLPLPLVSMTGRNGVSVAINALYQGVIGDEATTWNMDDPTGVLGLGWSLPLEQVIAMPAGTAAKGDMTYFLVTGGIRNRLLPTDRAQEFAVENYEFWSIVFDPSANTWTVRHENGDAYLYGGASTGSDYYIENGVRWNEWIGSSVEEGATTYSTAWNLRTISNGWGTQFSFTYEYDEVPIGVNGPSFTRASRLKTIVDVFGRQATLNYELKTDTATVREIQPPHVNPDGTGLQAFQDAYEIHYLKSIEVTDFAGQHFFSIVVESSLQNFGDAKNPYLYKRCIDAIYTQYAGAAPEPGMTFTYCAAGEIAPGSLKSVALPSGNTVTYNYGLVRLENAPTIVNIDNQPGTPRVWFGSDYVVTTFQQDSALSVAIYNWSGGWSKVPVASLSAYGEVKALRVAVQSNYFVLYYEGADAGALNATAFVRSPYLPDRWNSYHLTETVDRVVLGTEYFLVHSPDSTELQPYRVTDTTVVPEPAVTIGSKDVAIAASGNAFVAFAYNSISKSGTANFIHRSDLGTWTRKQVQTISDIYWEDWVKDSFWGAGNGFAAATYVAADEKTYRVSVLQWTSSLTNPTWTELKKYDVPTTGKLPFVGSRAADNVIANDEHLFRFDGDQWLPRDIGPVGSGEDDKTLARFAYGSDLGLMARLVNDQTEYSLATYDPYLSRWNTTRFMGSGGADKDAPFPATAGKDYITVGNALYFRGARSDWQEVSGGRLGDSVNLNSVKNVGPMFILSEDTSGTSSNLVLLKNGGYVPQSTSPYLKLTGQRCYVPGESGGEAPGTTLVGNGSFITYSGGPFGPGVGMKLYRVIDDQLDLKRLFATATVVKSLTVSNPVESYVTHYDYNEFSPEETGTPIARGATYDPSGRIAEFSKVSTTLGDGPSTGASVKYFLNGVAPQERTVFYPPNDPYSNARTYASLMNGMLVAETLLDNESRPVGVSLSSWEATLVPIQDRKANYVRQRRTIRATNGIPLTALDATPGDIDLLDREQVPKNVSSALSQADMALGASVEVFVFEFGLSWLLLDNTNDRAFPISYTPKTGQLHLTATLRSTGIMEYNPRNGQVSQQSQTSMDQARGLQERVTRTLYLCDVLPDLAAKRHLLSQTVQTTNQTSFPALGKVEYTGAQVNLYWSWAKVDGSDAWVPTASLEDSGLIDTWKTFLWHHTAATAPDAPIFNGWQNGQFDPHIWRRQLTISRRTASGQEMEKLSLDGVPAVYIWDKKETQPIARFANALVSEGEASYYAFASNEANPGWLLNGKEPEPYRGDAHTGSECARLPGVNSALRKVFRPKRPQAYYFTCWVKTKPGFSGNASWTFVRESDGHPLAPPLPIPDTNGQWKKLFRRIDLSADKAPALVITASNTSGHDVLIDNLRFSPMEAAFTANAIAPDSGNVVATLDTNAVTTYALLSYSQRPVGSAGAGDSGGWQTGFLWRAGLAEYDPTRPNTALSVVTRTGAQYARLLPDTWQDYWQSSSPDHWKVRGNALVATTNGSNALTLKQTVTPGAFAIRLQVTPPKSLTSPISLRLRTGIGAMNEVTLALEPGGDSGIWRLYAGNTPISDPVPNPRYGPVEWSLIASDRALLFFVEGYRVFSRILAGPVGGPVEFIATQADTALQEMLVAQDPVVTIQFQNGEGKPTQTHQLDGESSHVNEAIYDAIGRAAIATKTAALPASVSPLFAYCPDFAIMDWASGKMQGWVGTYYSPSNPDAPSHDDGYPFSRQRFENSPLGRVVETGLPGAAHAIRTDGAGHTTRREYTLNQVGSLSHQLGLSTAQYAVTYLIDSDGNRTVQVQDKTDTVVGAGSVLETGYSLTGSEYDAAGNLIVTRTPDAYNPPPGSKPDQFITTARYDGYHTVVSQTANELETVYIRDPAGRVRFMQDPRGRTEGYFTYWTYDGPRRNIETGVVTGTWDPIALAERAANLPLLTGEPDWPTADVPGVTWSKRLYYDGDGTHPNQIGALDHSEVANAQGNAVAVHEAFTYDDAGHVQESAVGWPQEDVPTQRVRYVYDAAGNLTAIQDDATLEVTYQFDRANRVTGVGKGTDATRYASYAYYPSGLLSEETLNAGAVRLPRRYNSVWQVRQLGDGSSPFQETLSFDVRPNGASGYFNGQIAATAYAYHWQDAPTGFSCEYTYDRQLQIKSSTCSVPDWSIGAKEPISYDANGNILHVPLAKGEDLYIYQGNVLNKLESGSGQNESFRYDPNQSVSRITERGIAFAYDRATGLTASATLDSGTVAAYTCNAMQQRSVEHTITEGAETKRFLIYGADSTPLIELVKDANGVRKTIYVRGPMGLLAVESEDTCFVLRDHLGSSRVILDEENQVVAGYDYSPFGALLRSYGPRSGDFAYRFTGQRWDEITQTYDFGARLYDPSIRRFLANDPAMQYASPYLYAGNNPLSMIDPTGAFSWNAFWGAVVGAIEVAVGIVLQVTATAILEFFSLGTATPAVIALDMFIGGLIGAGAQSFIYSVSAGDDFSWGQWGIQQGIGAAIGVATAGFGSFAGWASGAVSAGAGRAFSAGVGKVLGAATEWGANIVGGAAIGIGGQLLQDAATGTTPGSDLGWATLFGAIGGAVGVASNKITAPLAKKIGGAGADIAEEIMPRTKGWIGTRMVLGAAAGGGTGYLLNGFANLAQGEDWNKNWAINVGLGLTLGMASAVPKSSAARYHRLRESQSSGTELQQI